MGKYSSYGSLGWIFGALGAALVRGYSPFILVEFPGLPGSLFNLSVFQDVPSYRSSLTPRLWPVVIRNYRIYLAVFLRHLGSYRGMDHPSPVPGWPGPEPVLDRVLVGINFIVQFIVMRCLQQFSASKVFAWGQLLSILVFVAYAFASGKLALIAVNALLGVAWSCLYVGALVLVLQSGEERGTAGVFSRLH